MTKRRRISTKDRVSLFTREKGICHQCKGPVTSGQGWQVSHIIPLALGGADDPSNWGVIHIKCHKALTATEDVPRIAKAKRQEARHIGAVRPKQSIKSRGFDHKPRPHKLPVPPARSIYEAKR